MGIAIRIAVKMIKKTFFIEFDFGYGINVVMLFLLLNLNRGFYKIGWLPLNKIHAYVKIIHGKMIYI